MNDALLKEYRRELWDAEKRAGKYRTMGDFMREINIECLRNAIHDLEYQPPRRSLAQKVVAYCNALVDALRERKAGTYTTRTDELMAQLAWYAHRNTSM